MITHINYKMKTSEDTFNIRKDFCIHLINQVFCWSSFDRVRINKWKLISLVYVFMDFHGSIIKCKGTVSFTYLMAVTGTV